MLTRLRAAARRQVGALAADGFFNAAARLGRMHPRARPERHGVEVVRDQRYLDDGMREHLLDVYRPLGGEGPWPVVFYVHGGGFRILSKDTHWVMGLAFARRGFLVVNVSYRLSPKHKYPAAIDDVCRAFVWTAEHAKRFGGDTSRVVLAGESAGANLVSSVAVALAYRREEPFARAAFDTGIVPRAVIPACGVFQVSDMERFRRRKPSMRSFVADRLEEVEASYLGAPSAGAAGSAISTDLANPLQVIERGAKPDRPIPPFFLPVGTRDPLLPDTRAMAQALRAMGVEARDRYYPGEMHAFHAFVMRKVARDCWKDTFDFLDEHASLSP